jgi:hypothetical protein
MSLMDLSEIFSRTPGYSSFSEIQLSIRTMETDHLEGTFDYLELRGLGFLAGVLKKPVRKNLTHGICLRDPP